MQRDKLKKAFSLIELSVVTLIIAILIAGIIQSSKLISLFKLNAARSITKQSPVPSIEGLTLWLETTSEDSFDGEATENGTQITSDSPSFYNWKDLNPQISPRNNVSSADGAIYTTNCINDLPCLRFDGTSHYFLSTQDIGTTQQVTIFAVFSTDVLDASYRSLISTTGTWSTSNKSFAYGISSNSPNLYFATAEAGLTVVSSTIAIDTPYISHVIDDGNEIAHHVSGLNYTDLDMDKTAKSLEGVTIGALYESGSISEYFDGDLGEIIIFNRALTSQERSDIEEYLSKKWGIDL